MENTWSFRSFSAASLQAMIQKKQITIPTYQRGIVWKDEKKSLFVDSIKNGFPFGSILLYDETDKGKGYQLIDGLQRCNTIFDFITNPINFFSADDIGTDAIHGIYNLIGISNEKEVVEQEIITKVVSYLKKVCKTMDDVTNIQYVEIAQDLAQEYPSLQSGDTGKIFQVANLLKPSIKEFQNICRALKDAPIPAIIFNGDPKFLPTVFERINKQGSTLTKYQIFAATWNDPLFKLSHEELLPILDYVCNRYDSFTSGNVKVDDYDAASFKARKMVNAFDLCYGFGKILKNKFPALFGANDSSLNVDSIGFNLVNSCLGKKASEISTLHKALRDVGDDETVQIFLSKIIACANDVNRHLRELTQYKGNSQDSQPLLHSENQIISVVASEFILKYGKISKSEKDELVIFYDFSKESDFWKAHREEFAKTSKIFYVMDSLDSAWSGTGDKKLFSIISDPNYYLRTVSLETEFLPKLEQWFNDVLINRKEEIRVSSPRDTDSILLNIIHLTTTKATDALNDKTYDIEHIAPKNLLKKILLKYNNGLPEEEKTRLPISSIGNMCYLPTHLNRSKEDKTIYHANLSADDLRIVEEKYTFTKPSDLAFIDECDNLTAKEFKDKYLTFVKERFYKNLVPLIREFLFSSVNF